MCDRGNYPVVAFVDDNGVTSEAYPSVCAEKNGDIVFGLEAAGLVGNEEWNYVRSFKRLLCKPSGLLQIGSTEISPLDLVSGFTRALIRDLKERSNYPKDEPIEEVILATPADAKSWQRFWTLEGFRAAGLNVISVLSEPAAAGVEYADRHGKTFNSVRQKFLVFDLGGGTFDVSLMAFNHRYHELLNHAGINDFGGDNFDQELAKLVMAEAGVDKGSLTTFEYVSLMQSCKFAKESISPNTRKVAVELQGELYPVSVADFYDACSPRLLEAIDLAVQVAGDAGELAGIYVVGGASSLPLVGRMLREKFSKRVRRTSYPAASIAIGLAIAFDPAQSVEVSELESSHFGVFRELKSGDDISFDSIFEELRSVQPGSGMTISKTREYRAAHNIGHYRFAKCATVAQDGSPKGELSLAGEFYFPFDVSLRNKKNALSGLEVTRINGEGPMIREEYTLDINGQLTLEILAVESGFRQKHQISFS